MIQKSKSWFSTEKNLTLIIILHRKQEILDHFQTNTKFIRSIKREWSNISNRWFSQTDLRADSNTNDGFNLIKAASEVVAVIKKD
jgi:hypothetical protein